MKADLPTREPKMLESWTASDLYGAIQKKHEKSPMFLLHDGPPYANGLIHTGHALNKILKDFVIKFKSLSGYKTPYVPGWDCHGLPIEHQLFKEMGKTKHQVSRSEFREKAAAFAMGFVQKQKADFIRLGVLGEWERPYLTLTPDYEAGILEVLFELREAGFISRSKKPGYWCAYDETALAEAEVEYADKKSDSIFVRFKVKSGALAGKAEHLSLYVLIWTTTPWTLPANVGLAFHPDENYVVIKKGSDAYVVAVKLKETVMQKLGGGFEEVGSPFPGKSVVESICVNPLHGRDSRVITAPFVTMMDGTGIVHIAPGHGVEDFQAGQKWGLPVLSPVDESGRFDADVGVPSLVGKHVLKDANAAVKDALGAHLLFHAEFKHSYPHCWRCKNPIIFRATEQWFLRVEDEFRKKLLKEIDSVRWEPSYGIHRIKGMIEQRPDWCLSRQRHWGTPIAVFYCKACHEPLKNALVDKFIVDLVREKGASVWYEKSETEFVADMKKNGIGSVQCAKCHSTDFVKETDILDVWFDSGVSWHTVIEKNWDPKKIKEVLYLEGSDQHRGWFQTSLIPSVALRHKAPYQTVLTHGFVVDGKGHKMSKSMGNVISPQDIINKYGADILRLWVAMSDYREDVRLSQDILNQIIDVYRKFRNTFRFLLQNTSDFNVQRHGVAFDKMEEIDRWILVHFEEVKARVIKAYEAYEFHVVLSELNRFVAVTLSGFYLDAHKDRLYCEAAASPLRRSAQTAFVHLTRAITVLLSPLLSFTSEETYLELRRVSNTDLPASVFLDQLSDQLSVPADEKLNDKWVRILEIRSLVNDVLDRERKASALKSSQEAAVVIDADQLSPKHKEIFSMTSDWPFLLQVSEVNVNGASKGKEAVLIAPTKHKKCERCWRHRPDVGSVPKHPTLCARCASVVLEMNAS